MDAREKIIVALDVDNLDEAHWLIHELKPYVGYFKIGLELLTSIGTPAAVTFLHGLGVKIFLDGKFSDIPNTVGKAISAASKLKVDILNVHASAGYDSLKAAADNKGSSLLLAVTVLTSLSAKDIWDLGYPSCWPYAKEFDDFMVEDLERNYIEPLVRTMAIVAKSAGVDGVICSPKELSVFSNPKYTDQFEGFLKVTPGVRPEWSKSEDQKRIMTPGEAILAGADMIVIGRPITQPPKAIGKPVDAAQRILEEISNAMERSKAK